MSESEVKSVPWTAQDQEEYAAACKKWLAEVLRGERYMGADPADPLHDQGALLECVDSLRNELIAWCEGREVTYVLRALRPVR